MYASHAGVREPDIQAFLAGHHWPDWRPRRLGLSVLGVVAVPWWVWAGLLVASLSFAQYRAFRDVVGERDKLRPIKSTQDALGKLAGLRENAVHNLLNRRVDSPADSNA